jgi:hypothetical protein
MAGGQSPAVTQDIDYQKCLLVQWHRTLLKRDGEEDWIPVCETDGEVARYPGYVNAPA